jgi:serine/threonine protein kinase
MDLHPLHPAAWVIEQTHAAGWEVLDLLAFTRASTLIVVSRSDQPPAVLKAGFGSDHVLAEMDEVGRRAAYGFYWYAEMTSLERALSREDFRHERMLAHAARGIEHVIPVLQEGSFDRFDWYTMPYCQGGNFRPFLFPDASRHREDLGRGLGVLADVADGLNCLHQRGIVHRDVYQENILIHDGRGLVTDLGAARRIGTPRGPATRGPEVHWPPEYGHAYNTATSSADVFSLAVLAYRLLCHDIPRHGHSGLGAAPAALRPVISNALAATPAARPTMAEVRDALRESAASYAPAQAT